MGILDEAIREHLDLKRRRGADPAEIERAEREALGPVRRLHGATDAALDPEPIGDEATAYDGEEGDWDDDMPEEPALGDGAPLSEHDHLGVPESDEPWRAEDRFLADHPEHDPDPAAPPPVAPPPVIPPPSAAAPPPAAATPPPARAHDLGEDTAEYHLPPEGHPEAAGEDVLEETPEFLQDTPDHDRLWFEQRPPRDFDFEG
jgi:hypothetical protein